MHNTAQFVIRRSCLALSTGLAVAVLGCLKIPEGIGTDKLGAIEVVVTDQSNEPVADAEVVILNKSGNVIIHLQSKLTTTTGQVRFEAVQQATLQLWAVPPEGYTGGGEANPKPVTVTGGMVTETTYKLCRVGGPPCT